MDILALHYECHVYEDSRHHALVGWLLNCRAGRVTVMGKVWPSRFSVEPDVQMPHETNQQSSAAGFAASQPVLRQVENHQGFEADIALNISGYHLDQVRALHQGNGG